MLISCCLAPSANGQSLGNGTKTILLSEDFEGGVLPTGWSNDFGAATYGWLFGTDLSSAFWNIPPHTTYACANDDSCNCDMINVNLTTPSFNNSVAGAVLEFDYLSYSSSDVSEVQISIDGGINYTTLETLTGSGGAWIDDYTIDLSSYLSSDVRIRFHYSDAGGWAWGFCIDNVEISSPGGDDLAVTGIRSIAERVFHLSINSRLKEMSVQPDLLIEPHAISGFGYFNLKHAEKLFEIGYKNAIKILGECL